LFVRQAVVGLDQVIVKLDALREVAKEAAACTAAASYALPLSYSSDSVSISKNCTLMCLYRPSIGHEARRLKNWSEKAAFVADDAACVRCILKGRQTLRVLH
jgi:hypothetical protein